MKYKQRFQHPMRTPAAFQRRHHRQHRYRMEHVNTRRLQQNGFRWYRVEMRKALRLKEAAWVRRLREEAERDQVLRRDDE